MKLQRKLLIWGCLTAFAFSHLAPSNAAGTYPIGRAGSKMQTITWSWSDGEDRGDREFSEEDYWSIDELPVIELQVLPANPLRRILLERFDDSNQSWEVIAEERTNKRGEVNFSISPDCQNDSDFEDTTWCDYSETLRMRVLKTSGQKQRISQSFEVAYASSPDDDSWDSENDWESAQN